MNENKQLLTEWLSFDITSDQIKESRERNGGKIILKGILQKANTLNQNGRIYPESILEREVRNYQKFIKEKRALGECVDKETQIFTTSGWKHFDELTGNEIVYTLDTTNNALCESKIEFLTKKKYIGKMLHFKNSYSVDMKLTPDHKILLFDRYGKSHYMSASDVYELHKQKSSWLSHCSLKFTSNNDGISPEIYNIPNTKIMINPDVFSAFMGIYISEGCCDGTKRGYKVSNAVQITQKKKENICEIRDLLKKTPFVWKERTRKDGKTVDFVCNNAELHDYLFQFGHSRTKFIHEDILQWNRKHLEILLKWLLMGDGRNRICRGQLVREYYTTSSRLANDISKLFLKLGVGSNMRSYIQYDRILDGRVILSKNSAPMWIISENKAKDIALDIRFLKIEEVDHDDNVYCVTTDNGNWLAKRHGKMFWTGNCDHPDSSVVELKNVSHIIREAYMQGSVCYGTVELLDTPSGKILQSLVESGVTLGISSRGVGSTKRDGDTDIVQDDFQLICWDMVSEPSTPGAFMMKEGRSVSQNEIKKHFTKSDRIFRIFTDIEKW